METAFGSGLVERLRELVFKHLLLKICYFVKGIILGLRIKSYPFVQLSLRKIIMYLRR